ncbi:sugar ABC transporter substrate-binding protein [uncultured Sphaerochaeta sp.]|uniref:ABC transporter substrate-binding protein n=1 Tax=uncultured Sphaerochaeta sp. TaxID=886478 RepID=UPI002A0A5581|nr:sugar ABC transporter substrate-binding protein [uncultured Sphaerochaeta sp.]
MKKTVLIISILAICASLSPLFAQGSKETAATDTAKKTDLLLWLPPFASSGDTLDEQFWSTTLAPWAKENNVNLSIEITPWGGYEEKYLTGFASGDGPDVGYMYMQMFDDYIEMGALENLDPYFTQAEKDNYYYYDQGKIKGAQYALPFVVGNARVMYANMDILKKAGVTKLPQTWDEFIQACLLIKKNVPDVTPFGQAWADPSIGLLDDNYFPYLWQAGGKIYNDEGTKLALMDNDAAIVAAQFLYDLRFKYGIIDEAELGRTTVRDDFKQGTIAFACMDAKTGQRLTDAGINWDFIPSLEKKTKAIWVASDALIINSASKHKDLAASLIKTITSAPIMTKFHTEVAQFTPISRDEVYNDNPQFKDMYEQDTAYFHTLPVAKGSATIMDNMCKNLQLMMMGEVSPEKAIQMTMDYSKNVLN